MRCTFCGASVSGITEGVVLEIDAVAACLPCVERLIDNAIFDRDHARSLEEIRDIQNRPDRRYGADETFGHSMSYWRKKLEEGLIMNDPRDSMIGFESECPCCGHNLGPVTAPEWFTREDVKMLRNLDRYAPHLVGYGAENLANRIEALLPKET